MAIGYRAKAGVDFNCVLLWSVAGQAHFHSPVACLHLKHQNHSTLFKERPLCGLRLASTLDSTNNAVVEPHRAPVPLWCIATNAHALSQAFRDLERRMLECDAGLVVVSNDSTSTAPVLLQLALQPRRPNIVVRTQRCLHRELN